MAFSDFTYPEVFDDLGLTETTAYDLFADAPEVPAPAEIHPILKIGTRVGVANGTEKARSEWLITPVLMGLYETYRGNISILSGPEFNADPDAGLNGYCDFIIGHGPQLARVTAPVAIIIEAKREDIVAGFGQCVAGMLGAQRYNAKHNKQIDRMYGCVTSGTNWRFLQLHGTTVTIDQLEYTLPELDKLLGIFAFMLGPIPTTAAA